ncbi:MAG TPA: SCO family protein [Gallionella sp.]|nr:SCO family protein [Gallionella sp.]
MPTLLLMACNGHQSSSVFHASDVGNRFVQADFHLTDHNGKPRTLADFRGKVVVLFFGYTHCPDVCPTKLADLAQTMRLLGNDADKVQVLFITLDPERDTRELLAKFVPSFSPVFLGLYGDVQETASVAQKFRVDYSKNPTSSGYTLDHSTFTYLIDTQGKVRLMAGDRQPADLLAQDIRALLALH